MRVACRLFAGMPFLLLVLAPAALHAQGAALNADPDAARDAGFAAWRDSAQAGITERITPPSGRLRVLIRSAVARDRAPSDSLLARALAECSDILELDEPSQRSVVASRAWQAQDAAVRGLPRVAITIVPSEAAQLACTANPRLGDVLLENGVLVGNDTLAHPRNQVGTVQVLLGDVVADGVTVTRAPVRKLSLGGYVGGNGLDAARLYLRFEDLVRATETSRRGTVRLLIGNGQGLTDTLDLDPLLLRSLITELMPWRARRVATAPSVDPALPLPLPAPKDAELRAARERYEARAWGEATVRALGRRDARGLSRDDRTTARMQAAVTLAGTGDAAAARMLFRETFADEPCVALPTSSPVQMRELMDAERPEARCFAIPTSQLVTTGLVPGRIRMRYYGERGFPLLELLILSTAGVSSLVFHGAAEQRHSEYLREINNPDGVYSEVQSLRAGGNVMAAVFWAAYAWPTIRAVREERRFDRRLPRLTSYGSETPRAARIEPSTRGLGLAVYFF
jgi:hypothetical protein